MKPVGLFAYLMGNSTAPQGLAYDPFLGSGTTLIAAEQLGRKCYGMEISPAYCDVIVNRWEALTGKKAVLGSVDEVTVVLLTSLSAMRSRRATREPSPPASARWRPSSVRCRRTSTSTPGSQPAS